MAKRRPNNDGNIRRRPNGTLEVRVSLPGGERKSVYGKTQKEVQAMKRALQQQVASGLAITTGRQTVRQYLEHWLEHVAKPGIRASTYKSYESYVRLHLIPGLGHHKLTDLTPQHVQSFINEKSKSGLAPRTVQYIRAILRRALNQALKWDLVGRNVATLVTPPRSVKTQVVPLSNVEAMDFIDHLRCQDDRLGPLFTLAIVTGLRQGELFGLR